MLTVITPQRPSKEVVDLLKELSYKFVAKEAGRKGKAEGLAPATMFCLLHLVSGLSYLDCACQFSSPFLRTDALVTRSEN